MKTESRRYLLAFFAAALALGHNLNARAGFAQDQYTAIGATTPVESENSELAERLRKNRERSEERLKKFKAETRERAEQRLKVALEALATVNAKRQGGVGADTADGVTNDYFNALLNLSRAYDQIQDKAKALENFKEAAEFLKAQSSRLTIANKTNFMQSKFAHYPDDAEGDKNLLAYIDVCMTPDLASAISTNSETRAGWLPFDRAVLAAGATHRHNNDDAAKTKLISQQLLALYDAKRGKDSPTLASFLQRYANACITVKDLPEAEKALERICALDYKSNGSSPDTIFYEKLNLAQFYLRHNMLTKASSTWQAAEQQIDMPLSDSLTVKFCHLASQYKEAGHEDQMLAIYTKLLSRSGDAVLKNLDDPLEQLVKAYFSGFSYAQAENLIKLRLAASAKSHHDGNAVYWRVKQSDLDLATGRIVESKKIFDDVLANLALQGISTNSLRDDRAKLLQQLGRSAESAALRKTVVIHKKEPVTIRFGLQAKENIILGQNTTIDAYDSSELDQLSGLQQIKPVTPGRPQPKSTIACGGKIEIQGNLLFKGTISGAISDGGRSPSPGHLGATLVAAPPDVAKMPDALTAPDNTPYLRGPVMDQASGGDYILDPGDENQLRQLMSRLLTLQAETKSPTRIFISDKNAKSETIDLSSILNPGRRGVRPENLQFWYDGIRPIKLTGAGALIYAPNATVTIPFNGSFSGAIAAARIILEGNNRLLLDQSLINKTFQPKTF